MKHRLKGILIFLNILLVVLTIGAYVSPHIHPKDSDLFPILGLGYPALLFTHALTIFVWLFWDRKWAMLSVMTLLFGISSCHKIITVSVPDSIGESSLTVASFNANFSKPIAFADPSIREQMEIDFESYLKSLDDIQVLCLQEHGWRSEGHILRAMNFPFRHQVDSTTVAIYSKVPFANKGIVDFNSNIANTCLWVDLDLGTDTVRIYTTHLESNRDDGVVPEVIEQEAPENMSNSALLGIVKHYQKFSAQRVSQAQQIVDHRKSSPHPSIVCGDINDTPQSHTYRVLRGDMKDTFVEEGSGIGSTFGEKIPALRIDYIFTDRSLGVSDHVISRNDYSDHYLQHAVISY